MLRNLRISRVYKLVLGLESIFCSGVKPRITAASWVFLVILQL